MNCFVFIIKNIVLCKSPKFQFQFPNSKNPLARSRFRQSYKKKINNLTNTRRAYPDGTPKHDYTLRPSSTPTPSHRLRFSPFSIHTPSSTISHPHLQPPHPHHSQPPYHHPRYPIPTQPLTSLPFPLLLLQILRRFHHRLLRHSLLPPGRCQ